MIIYLKNKHTLIFKDFKFKCCIGANGLSKKKKKVITLDQLEGLS